MIKATEEEKGEYRKMSKRVNEFYGRGRGMNLQSLTRFDEEKGEWKPVLKRKWY